MIKSFYFELTDKYKFPTNDTNTGIRFLKGLSIHKKETAHFIVMLDIVLLKHIPIDEDLRSHIKQSLINYFKGKNVKEGQFQISLSKEQIININSFAKKRRVSK